MSRRLPDEPSLGAKISFLRGALARPTASGAVETLETHMAWLFLTEQRVYKLKKPVFYDYLDFSTLEARHRDAEAEVVLNRRLSPDVYLGIVALSTGEHGALELGGGNGAVDWLVEMRRLPDDLHARPAHCAR